VSKAWIIGRHEFAVTVRRPSFIVAAFVLPVVAGAVLAGMYVLQERALEESTREIRTLPLGVVDEWGGLKVPPRFAVLPFPGEREAEEALRANRIGAFVRLPADYLRTGTVVVGTRRRPTLFTAQKPHLPEGFGSWLLDNILRETAPERIERAKHPFEPRVVVVGAAADEPSEKPEDTLRRSMASYGIFFLLFTAIFSTSQYMLQGMAEEKEHRVMEMVLSSVAPFDLMAGKLIGLGAAGLLQMLIWGAVSLIGLALFAVQVALAPGVVAFGLVYFLLGYALYGSLMLGFGALGNTQRESHQIASVWTLIGSTPAFIIPALFESPHGTIPRVFSYIPFTAAPTMLFRYSVDPRGTPWIDVAGSAAFLVLATLVSLKASAKLFRVGLLLYGKRPGLREIGRWLFSSR
jgi:ABC-2 type transport system permease protein